MELKEFVQEAPRFEEFVQKLDHPGRSLLTGTFGSASTFTIASLFDQTDKPMLVVQDDLAHAQKFAEDLMNLVDPADVLLFPVEDLLAIETATSSPEFPNQRIQVLNALAKQENKIIVTSLMGVKRFVPTKDLLLQNQFTFKIGDEIEQATLIERLVQSGYRRQNLVTTPGEFAVRGSIIDIFPPNQALPVRLDFFDVELDSMRTFETGTQKSLDNVESVTFGPARDLIVSPTNLEQAITNIKADLSQVELPAASQTELVNNLAPMLERLATGILSANDLLFGSYLYPEKTSIVNYLDDGAGIVIFADRGRLLESEQKAKINDESWLQQQLALNRLLPKMTFNNDFRQIEKEATSAKIFMSNFKKGSGNLRFDQHLDIKARAVQSFFGQMSLLKTEVKRWQQQGYTVVILAAENERINKISQILQDFAIPVIVTTKKALQVGKVQIIPELLANGFEMPQSKLVVLTEKELFAKATKKRLQNRYALSNVERLKDYKKLKKGDYVVHVNHGIGQFAGIETLDVGGKHQDYLTILYRGDDKLFIPVSQLDRVQKYVSSESKPPKVSRLSSGEWEKTKRRVASKIEDIADELIELYAEREAKKGFSFSKDDSCQQEFEDAFPYTETDDQLRSAAEIKKDMEKARPMDRLLIGDVGYGKTEVALRAAFKAIRDGKQVALLAPTTVLAHQHYENILERFRDFPVEVGILSRFNTKKETNEVIEKLKTGEVDLVVGTHRLLSKDVDFANLGLLVIDEEQRFGVKHKERLKQLKSSIDVLTLTATPIPRTLNMSMLGVRDLSVIETAPLNRYPVQTYVLEQNYGVIIDGIRRELERGGQAFYLHNRVDDIEDVTQQLASLIPEAKIGYIHGQMTESQLERILVDFVAGEYNVLVTTTIIETGVDIPNVNTIFVENADRMGLSQLYQLRGRVGRSNCVAYAYFMYQPDKVLTEVSEKRLAAIKDFTELGAGFKIAMRDLAIRGAGNLLGKQQHGFIDAVGYDLYTQMLMEAVAKKQGVAPRVKIDTEITLDLEAYLPDSYISDSRQKIEIYKRLSQLENKEAYLDIQSDLIDRFGEYPKEVGALLEVSLLKTYASLALVEKIKQTPRKVTVTLSPKIAKNLKGQDLLQALSAVSLRANLGVEQSHWEVDFQIPKQLTQMQLVLELQKFLNELALKVQEKITTPT